MVDAAELSAQISKAIWRSVEELAGIWNYVGYDESDRNQRLARLSSSVESTLSDFIKSENATVLELNSRIEACRRSTADACQDLGIPPYYPDRNLTTCELLKDLQAKLDELNLEKVNRQSEYTRLRHQFMRISLQLGNSSSTIKEHLYRFPALNASDVPDSTSASLASRLPTMKDLLELEMILVEKKTMFEPIIAKFNILREDILRVASDIDYQPKTEHEAEILQKDLPATANHLESPTISNGDLCFDDEIEKIRGDLKGGVLNEVILEELTQWRLNLVREKARLVGTCDELRALLTSLWTRLGRSEAQQTSFLQKASGYKPSTLVLLQTEADVCRKERLASINTYLPRLKDEALDLARNCCVESQEREKLNSFGERDPEACLDYLEKRIEELKLIYHRHRQVYDNIATFQTLWGQLMQVEARMKDPDILTNRGGILLKTEKEKKRLLRELQKAETEANNAIDVYETETKERFKLSDGKTFARATQERWAELKGSSSRDPRAASIRSASISSLARRSVAVDNSGHPGAPS